MRQFLRSASAVPGLPRRLEQLDRISVWIFQLDLSTAWSLFHLVAEMQTRFFQRLDALGKTFDAKDDSRPAPWLLPAAIRQWA